VFFFFPFLKTLQHQGWQAGRQAAFD